MINTPLKQIFHDNKMGYCYINPDYTISEHNNEFCKQLDCDEEIDGRSIYQIIPEFTGLGSVFDQMVNKNKRHFVLENINRQMLDGSIKYFNFYIYPTNITDYPLIIITKDSTELADIKQKLNQQQYEITLLQSRNYSQNNPFNAQLLGESGPIKAVRNQINYVSRVPKATILLEGESGTGKSMIARILHTLSFDDSKPFVEINCAAIPETLLEAELFGYEKGAFTHAVNSKPGLLEEADGGTLFLDEIGEMPVKIQVKLLTFLETRKFRRLGSNKEIKVDLKLITATNQNLEQQVKKGNFREDLYYRLNVVNIVLPPLREIGHDIVLIAENFIKTLNIDFNKNISGFTKDAVDALLVYSWPGNVRELRNAVERAMIFSSGDKITRDDISTFSIKENKDISSNSFTIPPEGMVFEEVEKNILQQAMQKANGNQTKAAKLLHMSRDTFRYRLEKHQLIN